MRRHLKIVFIGLVAITAIIFGVVLGFLIWLSSSFSFTSENYFPSYPTSDQLDLYESNGEIIIPTDASEIYVYSSGLNELFTRIRFSINSDKLDFFIENTLCTEPLTEYDANLYTSSNGDTDPWTLKEGSIYNRCIGSRENTIQTIIVDITNPNNYIVYVFTSVYYGADE
jgi:hypothetical protein